jgi:RNA polymerase sigma-70 factor (ECF subfamily)
MPPKDSLGSADRTAQEAENDREHRGFGKQDDTAYKDVEKLVGEFLNGKPEAVRAVSGWVKSVVVHKAWGFQDTEDIVQATLLALVQNLRGGRFEPGDLRAYARRIAKNMCITNYRRIRARGIHVPFEEGDSLAGDRHSGKEVQLSAVLNRILESLSEGCRRIVLLAYIEGYSRKEIGGLLGVTEEAVRVRLHRCIQTARGFLKGMNGVQIGHV